MLERLLDQLGLRVLGAAWSCWNRDTLQCHVALQVPALAWDKRFSQGFLFLIFIETMISIPYSCLTLKLSFLYFFKFLLFFYFHLACLSWNFSGFRAAEPVKSIEISLELRSWTSFHVSTLPSLSSPHSTPSGILELHLLRAPLY